MLFYYIGFFASNPLFSGNVFYLFHCGICLGQSAQAAASPARGLWEERVSWVEESVKSIDNPALY
jgi:hypothetical protein